MAKKDQSSQTGKDNGSGSSEENGAYQVLARKYRPQNFDDLIGQDAMVRTLSNAFTSGRIAQAYMLTGVRGVGKTTTARILARALNYVPMGASSDEDASGPTIDIKELGEHCAAIMSSRHMDVVEMDAASHTGVDNIRELIESARYKPVNARYKVYIIDEVHMLSKGAFNALLKTLEEPPPHVKFIFATTEVRKVPVTVLSRCQRFDLKRVDIEELSAHFKKIADKEGVTIDDDALVAIARAAEGSVRDGLSLLDQAIALGQGEVSVADVRSMIGLADRARIFELLETVLKGDIAEALGQLEALHKDGAEGSQLIADLADAVHIVTRMKAAGVAAGGQGLAEGEIRHAEELSEKLSMPVLARAWQMLLKGLQEARSAPRAMAAAEMILIRLAYASDLPSPDDIIRSLESGGSAQGGGASSTQQGDGGRRGGGPQNAASQQFVQGGRSGDAGAPQARLQPHAAQPAMDALILESFQAVVDFIAEKRDMRLKLAIEDHARLVRFRPGAIELEYADGVPQTLAGDLSKKLSDWTGMRWGVSFTKEKGQPTLRSVRDKENAEEVALVKTHKLVQDFLGAFPEAEIKSVKKAALEPLIDDGIAFDDDELSDDDE